MDILIPFLVMCGFAAVIIYSAVKDCHRNRRKREQPEQRQTITHPPMDLRLKDHAEGETNE